MSKVNDNGFNKMAVHTTPTHSPPSKEGDSGLRRLSQNLKFQVTVSRSKEAVYRKYASKRVLLVTMFIPSLETVPSILWPQEMPTEFQVQGHSFKLEGHRIQKLAHHTHLS